MRSSLTKTIIQTDPANLANVPSLNRALGTRSTADDFVTALLQSSTDCIKYVELDGSLSVMNANGMCAMHIDDFSLVSGKHWATLWPEESAGLVRDSIAAANAGRSSRFEAFCPTAKGDPRWWDVSVAPVMGRDGQPAGIVSISRDVTSSVRDRQRIKEAAEHSEVLVREISHRVKNLFALVPALITMSARGASDVGGLVKTVTARVHALARSHALTLNAFADDKGVALEALIRAVLEPYEGQADAFTLDGPSVRLSSRHGNTVALMLHELATNAAKYGALTAPKGRIAIAWRVEEADDGDTLRFEWTEKGGPAVVQPSHQGFGTQLIDRMLAGESGMIEREWPSSGARIRLSLPLAAYGAGAPRAAGKDANDEDRAA